MSIGETLAQARHQVGLTIAEVSQRTRIRPRLIQSIEEDDFSECGGDFYTRGHIRSIARAVGIDPEPLIREYDRVWREPDTITDVLNLVTASRAAMSEPEDPDPPAGRPGVPPTGPGQPRPQPGARSWQPGAMLRRPPLPRRPRVAWTLTLAVALVVAIGLAGFRLLSNPGSAAPGPAARSSHPAPGATGAQPPAAAASSAAPAASSPASASAPAAHSPPPAGPLTPASVAAFGSRGGGDHAGLAHFAIDASRATAWHTDWYTTATFGNLYSGTGLLLNMGHPVTITSARIILGSAPGAQFQLRVGSKPALASLRPAARATGAAGTVTLRLHQPAHGQYVLIWFTRLPPDPAGTYEASVRSITLTGRS